jgi:hypothetical protein
MPPPDPLDPSHLTGQNAFQIGCREKIELGKMRQTPFAIVPDDTFLIATDAPLFRAKPILYPPNRVDSQQKSAQLALPIFSTGPSKR